MKPSPHGGHQGGNKTRQWDDTPEAEAMRQVFELACGTAAMARITGLPYRTLRSWQNRGKVSESGALLIETLEPFKSAGWTKEKIRPDVLPGHWA